MIHSSKRPTASTGWSVKNLLWKLWIYRIKYKILRRIHWNILLKLRADIMKFFSYFITNFSSESTRKKWKTFHIITEYFDNAWFFFLEKLKLASYHLKPWQIFWKRYIFSILFDLFVEIWDKNIIHQINLPDHNIFLFLPGNLDDLLYLLSNQYQKFWK